MASSSATALSSAVSGESASEPSVSRSRKRKRDPEGWKKNKRLGDTGKEYTTSSNVTVSYMYSITPEPNNKAPGSCNF
jgi:hypothetical protein